MILCLAEKTSTFNPSTSSIILFFYCYLIPCEQVFESFPEKATLSTIPEKECYKGLHEMMERGNAPVRRRGYRQKLMTFKAFNFGSELGFFKFKNFFIWVIVSCCPSAAFENNDSKFE